MFSDVKKIDGLANPENERLEKCNSSTSQPEEGLEITQFVLSNLETNSPHQNFICKKEKRVNSIIYHEEIKILKERDSLLQKPSSSPKPRRAFSDPDSLLQKPSSSPKPRRAFSDSEPYIIPAQRKFSLSNDIKATLPPMIPNVSKEPTLFTTKTWVTSKYVLSHLEIYAKTKFSQGTIKPSKVIRYFLEEKLTDILEIQSKIKQFVFFENSPFLTEFALCYDAALLQKKIKLLKKPGYQFFVSVVGNETLACLDLSLQKSTIKEWKKFIQFVHYLNVRTNQVLSQKVNYPSTFDRKFPISKTKKDDILSSFRTFYNPKFKEENKSFYFNKEWIPCPYWASLAKGINRKTYFIKWLICNLNKAFGVENEERAINEAKIVYSEVLGDDVIKHLIVSLECLKAIMKEHEMKWMNMPAVESELYQLIGKTNYAPNFVLWIKKNFDKIFEQNKMMKSSEIVNLYCHKLWLKKCFSQVPCFRMLQAISFSAYAHCDIILRESLCPEIMKFNSDTPHLQYFPADDTQWQIVTDIQNQTFEITHVKPYRFIKGVSSAFEEWGTLNVHWKLGGHLYKSDFSATLWFERINLSEQKHLQWRSKIIDNLCFKIILDQSLP